MEIGANVGDAMLGAIVVTGGWERPRCYSLMGLRPPLLPTRHRTSPSRIHADLQMSSNNLDGRRSTATIVRTSRPDTTTTMTTTTARCLRLRRRRRHHCRSSSARSRHPSPTAATTAAAAAIVDPPPPRIPHSADASSSSFGRAAGAAFSLWGRSADSANNANLVNVVAFCRDGPCAEQPHRLVAPGMCTALPSGTVGDADTALHNTINCVCTCDSLACALDGCWVGLVVQRRWSVPAT